MYDVWSKYRQNRRQILSVLPSTFGPWPKECSAHTHTHTHTHTYKHPHTCVEYMTAVRWICVDSVVCYQERTAQADREKKKKRLRNLPEEGSCCSGLRVETVCEGWATGGEGPDGKKWRSLTANVVSVAPILHFFQVLSPHSFLCTSWLLDKYVRLQTTLAESYGSRERPWIFLNITKTVFSR